MIEVKLNRDKRFVNDKRSISLTLSGKKPFQITFEGNESEVIQNHISFFPMGHVYSLGVDLSVAQLEELWDYLEVAEGREEMVEAPASR